MTVIEEPHYWNHRHEFIYNDVNGEYYCKSCGLAKTFLRGLGV